MVEKAGISKKGDEIFPKYKGYGSFEPAIIDIKKYLFKIITEKGPITRSELSNVTGIPRTTIYDNIVKLILDKQVRKYAVPAKKQGRPRVFYEITEKGL